MVFGTNPISVYTVVDTGPSISIYVKDALELRNTQYPVAPVTKDQFNVILVDDVGDAVTLVGAAVPLILMVKS